MTPEVKNRIEQIRHGNVPKGYKHSAAGIIPEDWEIHAVSEHLVESNILGSTGDIAKKITVKLWNKGVVEKKEVHIGSENTKYFRRKAGQFIYSKLDFLNCAFGIIPKELNGYESTLDLPTFDINGIEPFYLLSQVTQRRFYERWGVMAANGGRKARRISPEDFLAFPITFPCPEEQTKIAEILTTQDKVIELKEKRLAEKQRQKKYLMQQLLTGKKRLKDFSKPWSTVELEEVFDYIQPTPYLVESTNYANSYSTPVLTAGKTFVLGFTNETTGIYNDLPVIIFDDFTTDSKYVDFPFKAKSSAMKILKIKSGYNILFAYEAMQMIHFGVGGHERHWISKYSKLTIDVPNIEEQDAIAAVVSATNKELSLLKRELEQEEQKKKALMQLLLTGIVRVNA